MKNLDVNIIREFLDYDAMSGVLTWKLRALKWFKTKQSWRQWNLRYAGKEAFAAIDGRGYKIGALFKKCYPAHRIAWAHYHGKLPTKQIDHINGVETDNRIENLREVSHAENGRNAKKPSDNSSGHVGVWWRKDRNKWTARITFEGKLKNLGCFETMEEAVEARKKAEREFGFHPNHGR